MKKITFCLVFMLSMLLSLDLNVYAASQSPDIDDIPDLAETSIATDDSESISSEQLSSNTADQAEIKHLQQLNDQLEHEVLQHDLEATRELMLFITIAFLFLLTAFVLTMFYWRKFRKNSYELGHIANRLSHERDRLRHEVFYAEDTTSSDKDVDLYTFQEWSKQRRQIYRKNHDVSTFMAQSIVNDLIHIAFLGKNRRLMHIQPSSVDNIMRRAVNRVMEFTDGKAKISVEYPEDDFNINTDPDCVSHMIGQILYGMATHNDCSTVVSMAFRKDDDEMLQFIFTAPHDYTLHEDTDSYKCLISAKEMAENPNSGIFIDRIIAMLLASDIKDDGSFKEGQRFVFSTPCNLQKTL